MTSSRTLLLGALLALFLPAVPKAALIEQEQFNQANALLEKGDLDKAQEIYATLVRKGFGGTALAYNLGNIAYRKGERGKAILWYERARMLSPRDGDVQFNLAMARSHLKDEKDPLIQSIISTFTENELAATLLLLLWIFFGVFGALRLGWIEGELWPAATLWTSGLFLLLTASWLGLSLFFGQTPAAVVTQSPGEVRNGPGNDYAVGFTVPEGSKVIVLNQRPDWIQIGVPQQGLKGWVKTNEIETVRFTSASSS